MQQEFEEQYHNLESSHWWFVGRRQVVHDLAVESPLEKDATILEIGCSGGDLMERFRRTGFRQVQGIDISEDAIELCRKRELSAQVMDAQKLGFPDASFDLVIASDVLEHLPDEARALSEWRRVLKPGGILMVFVPAFKFLWTAHDVANKHQRRYREKELTSRMVVAGFTIERSSYWNSFLFLPIAAVRLVKRLLTGGKLPDQGGHGDLSTLPTPINLGLIGLLSLENSLIRAGINLPLGVSVMALGRNPTTT